MTALVSLLFIAMTPIDCKITNFSLHLYMYIYAGLMGYPSNVLCIDASNLLLFFIIHSCFVTRILEIN